MERLIEQINRILPLLNFIVGLGLAVLIFMYFISDEKLNKAVGKLTMDSPVILVIKDRAVGTLDGKQVEVIDTRPLKLKIVGTQIFVEKEGKWVKLEYTRAGREGVIIVDDKRQRYLEGIKSEQKSP